MFFSDDVITKWSERSESLLSFPSGVPVKSGQYPATCRGGIGSRACPGVLIPVISSLESDRLAVIPTDTLYGIVCRAQSPTAVEKLYRVRGRSENKPCIILLENISGLNDFGVVLSEIDREALLKVWPGKVSVVFDCPFSDWEYLHRGTETLAFRIPDDEALRNLLHRTGPLLAPSANTEGRMPAHTIEEAKKFFAEDVDVYVDGGYRDSLPSTVARLQNGIWETLREGAIVLEH